MYYNEATGCDVNDRFEKILGTEFRFNVPYIIDKQKYLAALSAVGVKCCIPKTTVLSLSMHHDRDEDGNTERDSYTLFADSKDVPEESYDCIRFDYYRYEGKQKEEFTAFVNQVLACIIKPSIPHIMEIRGDIYADIDRKLTQLSELDDIIESEKTHNL